MTKQERTNKRRKLIKEKEIKMNKEQGLNGIRIPRPFGTTLALIQYHNQKHNTTINPHQTEEQLRIIKKRVIEQWAVNGLVLNERTYTLEQIAQYTNMKEDIVYKYMWKALEKIGKVIPLDKGSDSARVIFGLILKKSLANEALLEEQARLLLASQDGQYKPFISSTVNQALMNLVSGQQPSLQLLRMLTEKSPVNILITNDSIKTGTETLNTDTAIKLINEKSPSMLDDPHLADNHIAKYTTQLALPDINPRTQDVGLITQFKPPITIHPAPDPKPIPSTFTTIPNEEDFVI